MEFGDWGMPLFQRGNNTPVGIARVGGYEFEVQLFPIAPHLEREKGDIIRNRPNKGAGMKPGTGPKNMFWIHCQEKLDTGSKLDPRLNQGVPLSQRGGIALWSESEGRVRE